MDPVEFVKGWTTIRSAQRRPLAVADARKLLSYLAIDARHSPLQLLRNDAMAYLMIRIRLLTIEVSRVRIEHLHESVSGEKWRLCVHGKGRGSA
ncbi:MAG: hypothetical protein AB7P19_02260 [Nitrospira sp.]